MAIRRNLRRLTVLGAVISAVALVSPASAVVIQIDGTVVPQTTRIDEGLAKGENGKGSSNPASYTNGGAVPVDATGTPRRQGPIDRILDASEFPQVFSVPKTNGSYGTVTFIDLLEGAGFENTFGWYNVGDDLTDLRNLHPVLTCYNVNYEFTGNAGGNPSLASVDFEAQHSAYLAAVGSDPATTIGYKGGFIGFFLVTPEGMSGSNATCGGAAGSLQCGNPTVAGGACVGRIYYTEKEINGDGNYVHYLVYQTKVRDFGPTDPPTGTRRNDFYFGFEDLYRGGDNDFEDMLMLVQGLVVPCVPSPEVCDGVDNNCDGLVDNNPVDVGASGPDCQIGNATVPPNPAPSYWNVGACKPGKLSCVNGAKVCAGEVTPGTEVCNGADDNCNGQIDESVPLNTMPPAQTLCPTMLEGTCNANVQCIAGAAQCVATQGPTVEICNGVDDDCDGLIDETAAEDPTSPMIDVGGACGFSSVGICELGVYVCANGVRTCVGDVGPQIGDPCNGLDDDCDGFVDEDVYPEVGTPCGGGQGQCGAGTIQCIGGLVCVSSQGTSTPEICDGLDNNCNGQVDESPTLGEGALCGALYPPCTPGTLTCVDNNGQKQLDCVYPPDAVTPTTEVCNLIDDDCNGLTDDLPEPNPEHTGEACDPEGLPGPFPSNPPPEYRCKQGVLKCVRIENGPGVEDDTAGVICVGAIGPAASETCNGLDDNCDGLVDNEAPCPAGLKCLQGICTKECANGEFNECPGGYQCVANSCQPVKCPDTCPDGTECNKLTGQCEGAAGGAAGAGGSGTAGSAAGGTSAGGTSAGGTSAGGTGAGGNTAGSSGNTSAGGSSGSSGSKNNVGTENFGQATGGGGCAVQTTSAGEERSLIAMAIAAIAGVFARRRRSVASSKEVSR